MKSTIKIINGKRGFHLTVNGMYISHGGKDFCGRIIIKAITNCIGIPYGATEWVSIQAIKDLWHKHMQSIVFSTLFPYESVWGQLKLIRKPI